MACCACKPAWLFECFFALCLHHAKALQLRSLAQSRSVTPQLSPYLHMVDVRSSWATKNGNKWLNVPYSLVETFEGKSFLRFRPTFPMICQLVMKEKYRKNAGLTTSAKLQELLQLRNEAAAKLELPDEDAEGEEKEELFQAESGNSDSQKKRKVPAGSYLVEFEVLNEEIICMVSGKRPSKSDLMIQLVPEQLTAVVRFLEEDIDSCLDATPKAYKKK